MTSCSGHRSYVAVALRIPWLFGSESPMVATPSNIDPSRTVLLNLSARTRSPSYKRTALECVKPFLHQM